MSGGEAVCNTPTLPRITNKNRAKIEERKRREMIAERKRKVQEEMAEIEAEEERQQEVKQASSS